VDPSQTVTKAGTTTTVSAAAGTSVFGAPVTFTANVNVAAPGAGTATGTVTFTIDGVAQSAVALNNGQATLTTSGLSAGSHVITAAYNGDGDFNTSASAALNQTVNQAGTSTAISSSANPSTAGQAVTFTANVSAVSPGAGTPTGTVTFTVDGVAQTPVALSNGQATLALSTLSAGSHTITANYQGDGNFKASSSAVLNQTVNQVAGKLHTKTALHSSADPSVLGQRVTFTAIVDAVVAGAGTPTGTVTFTIDGKVQATVTLVGGSASFSTTKLTKGHHVVTVTYNGDSHYASSTSSKLNQTVNRRHHGTDHDKDNKEDHDHDDAKAHAQEQR
jgi:hypothetical protein